MVQQVVALASETDSRVAALSSTWCRREMTPSCCPLTSTHHMNFFFMRAVEMVQWVKNLLDRHET